MLLFILKNRTIVSVPDFAVETSGKEGCSTVAKFWGALPLYVQTSALLLTLLLIYYLKISSLPIRKITISRNRFIYLCLALYHDSNESSSICWTEFGYLWTPGQKILVTADI